MAEKRREKKVGLGRRAKPERTEKSKEKKPELLLVRNAKNPLHHVSVPT
jgi:hypothetical protein